MASKNYQMRRVLDRRPAQQDSEASRTPDPMTPDFVHLHTRSWFSFLAGGSSPRNLVQRAADLRMNALALTDLNGVYGTVRFQKACRAAGIHAVVGAEIITKDGPLLLLARSPEGYRNLCLLLTESHLQNRKDPVSDLDSLRRHQEDLICLTGGRESRLWQLVSKGTFTAAGTWLETLRQIFGRRLYVELCHGLQPDDGAVLHRLYRLAKAAALPVVATNDVRFATPDDYRRYDLLNCIRLGITVSDPHPQRPRNAEAYLKTEAQLCRLIPYPEAFHNTALIARQCSIDLVAEYITPPTANLPEGETALHCLRRLCSESLPPRYPPPQRPVAVAQMEKELEVIGSLELEEFFLVVREVVSEAERRGIRCAGRGSAANSIISYLLGITAVDPIRHHLLFERFLHGGRKGTPDIDVDFDADRRDEIIDWMENRFGIEQTAMTGTVVTYRLRLALRDVAKALGYPIPLINEMTEKVPSGDAADVREYRRQVSRVLGETDLLDLLLTMVETLGECPRHMGLHAGGMVLSRVDLSHFSPIQVSANGVKMVQFDKDDIEAMGLVKLDVLGLRMLACLSEAVELVERHQGEHIDLDSLPLDDGKIYEFICSGKTLALFQIESMGQMHLIAKNRPETFDDLIAEIALFRPGPLQGGMVHPFVRRRRGEEPVSYPHPDLEPLLKDTYGVILFQEQVLEIAHRFAGMSLQEADDFRALMSKFHDPKKMESMRERFVSGAVDRGVPRDIADGVFDQVSKFVGYGFCRSHAAAFAKTVYHSAWMKCHHPAAFMAAFMQHRPGMYNQMTLEEETRRFGISVLYPTINESGIRFDLARLADGRLAIRKPLTAVKGVSEDVAMKILWCRLGGPYLSVEDLARRVFLSKDVLDALARAGCLDSVAGTSRRALWEAGVISRRLDPERPPDRTFLEMPVLTEEDIPDLPPLTSAERLSWDYKTQSAARVHPITLARRSLNDLQVQPIESVSRMVRLDGQLGPVVTLAGLVIVRQKPPTAKGFMFLSIEDETGFVQCIVHPKLLERLYDILVLPTLIVRGELQATGTWRALLLREAWPLEGIFGGYAGFASASGGQTRLVSEPRDHGAGAGPQLDEVDEVDSTSPPSLTKAV